MPTSSDRVRSSEPSAGQLQAEGLMRRYQAGSSDAAADLVTALSPQIFAYLLAQTRDRSQAEDLLQDFWLRVHKARHTYRPAEPLLPWIYSIARRVQVDDYRRRSRIRKHELQSESLPDREAPQSATKLVAIPVDEMLKDLPPLQRETIVLLKVIGLSLEEAASAMNTSVGAVKQRAHRAFEAMRQTFGVSSGIKEPSRVGYGDKYGDKL